MFFCLVLREPLLQAKRANIERSFRNTPRNKHPQQSPQQPPQHRKHTSPAKIPPQAHIPWKNPSRKRTSPAKTPPRAKIRCKNPAASRKIRRDPQRSAEIRRPKKSLKSMLHPGSSKCLAKRLEKFCGSLRPSADLCGSLRACRRDPQRSAGPKPRSCQKCPAMPAMPSKTP